VFKSPVGWVRGVGFIEGVSALILFFGAMPLKYLVAWPLIEGQPTFGDNAVYWVGAVHGGLFVAYALVTFSVWGAGHLPSKLLGLAAVASIIPFGPFVLDHKLKAIEPRDKASVGG